MSLSHETQEQIRRFAKEQARHYVEAAEMTYLERLRMKGGQARRKIGRKLARFGGSSEQGREAQDDMILYMSDYVSDLMSRGLSEREALEKAREELAAAGEAGPHAAFHDRLRQYYEERGPAEREREGLLYGGLLFVGIAVGALIGYAVGGGRLGFLSGGWIDAAIGAGGGALLGMGLGLIGNAIAAAKRGWGP